MTDPIFIGIGGKLGSGKDVIADHLVSEKGFVKLGMSDALNDALLAVNPWVEVNAGGDTQHGYMTRYADLHEAVGYVEAKKTSPDVRNYLQKLGTEVGRDMLGPDVWRDIIYTRIEDHMDAGRSVIVTGIRFDNELEMVRELGGTAMWVDRPSLKVSKSAASHSSENGLDPLTFDVWLSNVGTLEELELMALVALKDIEDSNS